MKRLDTLTINIELGSEGDYIYKVWPRDLGHALDLEEQGDSEGDDNGGVCTGSLINALSMAHDAAYEMIRNANKI